MEYGEHRDPQRRPAGDVEDGHAFIRADAPEDAIYGGEMSAHHYFRDFALLRQRDDPVAAGGGAAVS